MATTLTDHDKKKKDTPLIQDLGKAVDDDEGTGMMEIPQSLCMACHESGTTKMIFTKIPFFREVIISSFECDSCGWTNNEVQFGGEIREKGCKYELKVTTPKDLNRQVIKSDSGCISIPELELEIPAKTQRGSVNTIEGVFQATIDGLKAEQDYRREKAPEVAEKVDAYITKLALVMAGDESYLPFTFILDDPAGNSFVENPHAPAPDPKLRVTHYERTPMQDMDIGLQPTQEAREQGTIDNTRAEHRSQAPKSFEGVDRLLAVGKKAGGEGKEGDEEEDELGRKEAVIFQQPCPNCHRIGEAVNCVTDIPYFKEVLIMAFTCTECGYRNNEIKGGGAIPKEGTLVKLTVQGKEDFTRDVLKSDTAGITIPEIDLEITQGSLGGFFTSVEGLLEKIRAHLKEGNPFGVGDSAVKHHLGEKEGATKEGATKEQNEEEKEEGELQKRFRDFMAALDDYVEGRKFPFTLELRDPLGNSFISFHGTSPEADPCLTTETYTRGWDEDEHLGLHDLATEGFETGYEGRYNEPLRSTLNAHPHIHGGDHPTPFAKGCVDEEAKK